MVGCFNMNDKVKKYVIIGLAVLCAIFFIGSCNRIGKLKKDLSISEQNQKALADSVRFTKNKVGDLESSINVLIADKKDLADLSQELADELKKEKGKVSELNKYIANIKPQIIYVPTEVIVYKPIGEDGSGIYGFESKYDTTYNKNNYKKFEILTKFSLDTNFNITPIQTRVKDEIGFDLVTGLRELDGNIEIFARSNYPNLIITDMKGAIIDPKNHPVIKKFTKPKRFGIGFYMGVGIYMKDNMIGFGPNIGAGVTYTPIQF